MTIFKRLFTLTVRLLQKLPFRKSEYDESVELKRIRKKVIKFILLTFRVDSDVMEHER